MKAISGKKGIDVHFTILLGFILLVIATAFIYVFLQYSGKGITEMTGQIGAYITGFANMVLVGK